MKNQFWKSKNFLANLINIILVFFAGAGVLIPEGTGGDLVAAIQSFNPVALGLLLISNILLPLFKTVRNKTGNWRASLLSTNFWGQIATAVLWIFSFYGVAIPEGTAGELVGAIQGGNTAELVSILLINVALPIIHIFLKPKAAAVEPNTGGKLAKMTRAGE